MNGDNQQDAIDRNSDDNNGELELISAPTNIDSAGIQEIQSKNKIISDGIDIPSKEDLLKELNRLVGEILDKKICNTIAQCGAKIHCPHLHRNLTGESTSTEKIGKILISLNNYLGGLILEDNRPLPVKTSEFLLIKLQGKKKLAEESVEQITIPGEQADFQKELIENVPDLRQSSFSLSEKTEKENPLKRRLEIKRLGKEIEHFFQRGRADKKWGSVNQCIAFLEINVSYEVFVKALNGDNSISVDVLLTIIKAFKEKNIPANFELISTLRQRLNFLILFGQQRGFWMNNNACREKIGTKLSVPYFNQIARGDVSNQTSYISLIKQIENYLLQNEISEEEIGLSSSTKKETLVIPEPQVQQWEELNVSLISKQKDNQIDNLFQIGSNLNLWRSREEWFGKLSLSISIEQYQYEQSRRAGEFLLLQDTIIAKTSELISTPSEISSVIIQNWREIISSSVKQSLEGNFQKKDPNTEVLREILDKVEFIHDCLNPMISMPVDTSDVSEGEKREKAKLFLIKLKELSEVLEFFKNGTTEDREILRSTIAVKLLTDIGRLLSAIGTEEQFKHWKQFNAYTFKI